MEWSLFSSSLPYTQLSECISGCDSFGIFWEWLLLRATFTQLAVSLAFWVGSEMSLMQDLIDSDPPTPEW